MPKHCHFSQHETHETAIGKIKIEKTAYFMSMHYKKSRLPHKTLKSNQSDHQHTIITSIPSYATLSFNKLRKTKVPARGRRISRTYKSEEYYINRITTSHPDQERMKTKLLQISSQNKTEEKLFQIIKLEIMMAYW